MRRVNVGLLNEKHHLTLRPDADTMELLRRPPGPANGHQIAVTPTADRRGLTADLEGAMKQPNVPREEFEARQARSREMATQRGFDGLVVIGRAFYDRPGHLAYLTNHFPPFPTMADLEDWQGMGHGVLVLPCQGEPTLIVDGRAYREDLVAVGDVRLNTNLPRAVAEVIREKGLGAGRLGVVGWDLLPMSMYQALREALPGASWVPADDIVAGQRVVKSPAEQALLRRAAEVATAGLRAALEEIAVGKREREINAAGTAAAMRAGADFVRYLRVHSGPWSAWGSRWPQATERRLIKGDLVTLDIIGAVQGYGFDVLRTTIVGWDTLPEQRRMCNAVLQALGVALERARPGARVGDLVRAGLAVMEEAGFAAQMSRFMGHGIGLETVEAPLLVPHSDAELVPGMVLCIEPSIYVPGWGGCSIEEEVIVTEDEPEVITPLARRLWE